MKKIIIVTIVLLGFLSQTSAQNPSAELANKIAQKMKDSLRLTAGEKNAVKNINMMLADQKKAARLKHQSMDSLRYYFQKIENKRDTLYSAVLTREKYLLYKKKKRNLVNNN